MPIHIFLPPSLMPHMDEFEGFILHTDLLHKLFQSCQPNTSQFSTVSKSVASIFWGYHREPFLLQKIILAELAVQSQVELAFREDSIAVLVIKQLLQLQSKRFIKKTIGSVVKKIVNDSTLDLELRPQHIIDTAMHSTGKAPSQEELKKEIDSRVSLIIKLINKLLHDFEAAITVELSNFAKILKYRIEQHFPGHSHRMLAGWFFLRLLVPSIVQPDVIVKSTLSPTMKRNLIIFAKILQSIGNEAKFDDKEDYMCVLSQHVTTTASKCHRLFDKIAQGPIDLQLDHTVDKKRAKKTRKHSQALFAYLKQNFETIFSDLIKNNPEANNDVSELKEILFTENGAVSPKTVQLSWDKVQRRKVTFCKSVSVLQEINSDSDSSALLTPRFSPRDLSTFEFSSFSSTAGSSSPTTSPLSSTGDDTTEDSISSSQSSNSTSNSDPLKKVMVKVKYNKKVSNYPIDSSFSLNDIMLHVESKMKVSNFTLNYQMNNETVTLKTNDAWKNFLANNGVPFNQTFVYHLELVSQKRVKKSN